MKPGQDYEKSKVNDSNPPWIYTNQIPHLFHNKQLYEKVMLPKIKGFQSHSILPEKEEKWNYFSNNKRNTFSDPEKRCFDVTIEYKEPKFKEPWIPNLKWGKNFSENDCCKKQTMNR